MTYDVDYYINKFEAIPEENWFERDFKNQEGTAFCALGHCGIDYNKEDSEESDTLIDLFRTLGNYTPTPECLESTFYITDRRFTVVVVNDGETMEYQQPTAKQRILAALYDIKAQQSLEVVKSILKEPMELKEKEELELI